MVDLYYVYTSSERYYHNLHHITDCFHELNKLIDAGSVENPEAMRLALWFHDYFQDHTGDDEERSAEKGAEAAIQLGYSVSFSRIVYRLILVTKHGVYLPETPDEQTMCDIDLAPLAADGFAERSDWIRREYSEVPDNTFFPARRAFLQGLLDRQVIFYTKPFQTAYEAKSRANLQMAVDELDLMLLTVDFIQPSVLSGRGTDVEKLPQ